jgi:enoyl-CoA hydratase/carnithine racemase
MARGHRTVNKESLCMSDLILIERHEHVAEIVLNRPDKRNALNLEMMNGLDDAFAEVERMTDLRAVIVHGEGPGFSAGIDLMSFLSPELVETFGERWRENLFTLTARYQGIMNRIERCALPVIALLHGYCLGMGFELALACDFRIAAEGTRLGLPEARLGLIPDVGGTTRLTRLLGPARAKEYIMTGREFDLADAERWGLVNHVVPLDNLRTRGYELAAELAQAAPLSVSYAKKVIDGLSDLQRGFQLEAWAQSMLIRTEDVMRGAQAMMAREPVEWTGR